MKTDELIQHVKRIRDKNQHYASLHTEASELLRVYAGTESKFYKQVETASNSVSRYDMQRPEFVKKTLTSFIEFLEAGLSTGVSPERQAQLDVVSDFLDMAQTLLDTSDVHAGAAAMLIGATLEEFLRNWVEAEGLPLGNRKPTLDGYCQTLREAELINKQDVKDITSWAGIRNSAAHGNWEEVADKQRIRNMLEGVNLFMRRYTPA